MIKSNEYPNMSSSQDAYMNETGKPSLKSCKFENVLTFANYFTKYNLRTGTFNTSKKIKYNSQNGGIPLGTLLDSVLVDSSDSHSMILGATGSKKSRLLVMPSVRILADAGESMIISDPKSEIYERTSGYLKQKGYEISVINLRDPSLGNSWNPLYIPYLYYKEGDLDKAYEFANDIAANLCLAEISVRDPFWDYSSRDLFFGLELLLFRYCYENNLETNHANTANLLRLRNYLFKNYYSSGSNKINDSSSVLNQYMNEDLITSSALIGTVNAPERTQSSILSTFDEKMRCFTINPKLLNMLSSNAVNLDDIGMKKTAIFIIMPDEKTTYHKLVTLFIKQSYEYIVYTAQKKSSGILPVRINYILDEFASLPSIKDFPSMISASRSRNIRFTLVVQSKHQLLGKYKEDASTIQSNCNNWIFLTSREVEMLEEISILCGKKNGEKPLVPMDALQHLNKEKGEALILSGRLFPIVSNLTDIKYYDGDQPPSSVPLLSIAQIGNAIDFSRGIVSQAENSLQEKPVSQELHEPELDDEIRRELEKKFDELFGPIDDSEDD